MKKTTRSTTEPNLITKYERRICNKINRNRNHNGNNNDNNSNKNSSNVTTTTTIIIITMCNEI